MTMKEYVDYIEICGEKVTAQDGIDIINKMNRKRKKVSILLRKIRRHCEGYKCNILTISNDAKKLKASISMISLISEYNVKYSIDKDKCMSLNIRNNNKIIPDHQIPKPTKEYFYQRMVGALEFSSNSVGYGRADTESYSACGYDDGVSYQKEYAGVRAVEDWRAYRELAFPNKKKYNDIGKDEKQCFMFLRQQGLFLCL